MENRGFLKNVKKLFGIFFTSMAYVSASERVLSTEDDINYLGEKLRSQINADVIEK